MGIIIHSLESVSFKDLYAAFSSAFKDYDFSLNADELRRMLDRRGYNPQLSFGAFFEGRLISFVFNGTGMYNNILTAYDTGTGFEPTTLTAYISATLLSKFQIGNETVTIFRCWVCPTLTAVCLPNFRVQRYGFLLKLANI